MKHIILISALALASAAPLAAQGPVTANPVLFATQVPTGLYGSIGTTFTNHLGDVSLAPRGGDLVIRYPDGSLRFLTAEAGYGNSGMQLANAIAVREPCVHWSGQKALFSMVIGAPTQRYQLKKFYWQIYEVTGLGQGETAAIRKIAGQPLQFNNVSPIYGTDDRILFVSDRPNTGLAHHYPVHDEYESDPVVSGIYSLVEATQELTLIEHAPSGAFSLSLDSSGRVIFTKWDHLQRDQQGDAPGTAASFGTFTYASEDANAAKSTALLGAEVFPEPRTEGDPAYDPALSVHRFNHFFPWEINQDGTAEETLNHIGRHELGGSYTDGSFKNDPNLSYYVSPSLHANQLQIAGSAGLFHFREDPANLGEFVTTYAGEFGTASGGTLMRLTAAPGLNADSMVLTALTPTDQDLVPEQTGYFRNPLPMSDGTLIAVHTPATGQITNLGTVNSPNWSYDYRLKKLSLQGEYYVPIANLTAGIAKNVSQWTPDELATYGGPMWELYPVEVMPRPVPVARTSVLPSVEAGVFAAEGVDPEQFREFLRDNGLALIVSRNVTQRDRADKQQPFNLQVPGGVSSIAKSGQVYQVAHMQIFQADALRGKGGAANPQPGRRLLARPMHQPGVSQSPSSPEGGVMIAADGSVAALVPAQRALTWQLTDSNGTGIVRERNWISFQAGEIRVCTSCHGINTLSQTGHPEPTNPPQALHDLLVSWKLENGAADTPTPAPTDTPQNTPTATATATASASATATDTATETVTPTSTETETPVPSETDTPPAQTPVPTEEPPTVGTCESGLTLRNHRLHAIGGMSRLMLRAALVLPKPWQEVDPASFGIRLTVPGMFDVEVPGGEGWSTAANGARWSYSNPDGAGGVKRIDVLDRSQREDGLLMVVMKMAEGFVMVAPQPLELTIRLGDAGECAVGQWHGPAGAKPRCRGRGGKLACR